MNDFGVFIRNKQTSVVPLFSGTCLVDLNELQKVNGTLVGIHRNKSLANKHADNLRSKFNDSKSSNWYIFITVMVASAMAYYAYRNLEVNTDP